MAERNPINLHSMSDELLELLENDATGYTKKDLATMFNRSKSTVDSVLRYTKLRDDLRFGYTVSSYWVPDLSNGRRIYYFTLARHLSEQTGIQQQMQAIDGTLRTLISQLLQLGATKDRRTKEGRLLVLAHKVLGRLREDLMELREDV